MILSLFKPQVSSIAGDKAASSWENEEIQFVRTDVPFLFYPWVLVTLSNYLGSVSVSHVTKTSQLNYSFTTYRWMNRILNVTDTYLLLNCQDFQQLMLK